MKAETTVQTVLNWASIIPAMALLHAAYKRRQLWHATRYGLVNRVLVTAGAGALMSQTAIGDMLDDHVLYPATRLWNLNSLIGHTLWLTAVGYFVAFVLHNRGAIEEYGRWVILGCVTCFTAMWSFFIIGGMGEVPVGSIMLLRTPVSHMYWGSLLLGVAVLLSIGVYHNWVIAQTLPCEREPAQFYCLGGAAGVLHFICYALLRIDLNLLNGHGRLITFGLFSCAALSIGYAATLSHRELTAPIHIPSHWPPLETRAELESE